MELERIVEIQVFRDFMKDAKRLSISNLIFGLILLIIGIILSHIIANSQGNWDKHMLLIGFTAVIFILCLALMVFAIRLINQAGLRSLFNNIAIQLTSEIFFISGIALNMILFDFEPYQFIAGIVFIVGISKNINLRSKYKKIESIEGFDIEEIENLGSRIKDLFDNPANSINIASFSLKTVQWKVYLGSQIALLLNENKPDASFFLKRDDIRIEKIPSSPAATIICRNPDLLGDILINEEDLKKFENK